MTRKDKILKIMLSHPIIKEKYNIEDPENIEVVGASTDNLMVEAIRTMIKEVEIYKKSEEEVVKTLLTMLNE
jgi:hypothetical protein